MNDNMKRFRPCLLPNEKSAEAPDWEERIPYPSEWLISNKLDGGRVELFADGTVKGRSLKPIASIHVNQMAEDLGLALQLHENTIIEAEFYSPNMNFAEIMHFFRSEDVTSNKTLDKYLKLWKKTGGHVENGWSFPGRTVEWVTTWHPCLKFYAFSMTNLTHAEHEPFHLRTLDLEQLIDMYTRQNGLLDLDLVYIKQNSFEHIDEMYQAYDQAIMDGCEGIVVTRKSAVYKYGRYTLNSNQVYKIKDDQHEYDGKILSVLEGTEARPGSERTVNELGRSKTSQLKGDRIPSGRAKGFEVLLDDGQIMTVSLNGYNHGELREMLQDHAEYSNLWIRFKAMAPVKVGGKPRGPAIFTKGNFRDAK